MKNIQLISKSLPHNLPLYFHWHLQQYYMRISCCGWFLIKTFRQFVLMFYKDVLETLSSLSGKRFTLYLGSTNVPRFTLLSLKYLENPGVHQTFGRFGEQLACCLIYKFPRWSPFLNEQYEWQGWIQYLIFSYYCSCFISFKKVGSWYLFTRRKKSAIFQKYKSLFRPNTKHCFTLYRSSLDQNPAQILCK